MVNAFDAYVEILVNVGAALPQIDRYRDIVEGKPEVMRFLTQTFEDILTINAITFRIFKLPG